MTWRRLIRPLRCWGGQLCAWHLLLAACGGSAPRLQTPAAAMEPAGVAPAGQFSPQPALPPGTSDGDEMVSGPAILLIKEGFAAPDSALYDIESDVYLISNVNGSPTEADDNGYISRLAPDGQMLNAKFIDGARDDIKLNAPKGMAISAGILFVADLDRIRKFDVVSGAALGEIVVTGASFLNDVAAGPDGTIYFTDTGIKASGAGFTRTGSDAVYKIVKDRPKLIAHGKSLDGPNGLIVDASGIWVVTFGGNELYNVKSGTKADVQRLPNGTLDGIVKTSSGTLYVSTRESNQVLVGAPGAAFGAAFLIPSPADIGYDVKRNRLLIPRMQESSLQLQPL
jgi:hypothetical protein